MKDEISVARVQAFHPKVRMDFTDFIDECESQFDITIRVVQGLRTFAQQQDLYEQGRTTAGKIVTDAKAGQSFHNYGLAIDILPMTTEKPNGDWDYDYSKFVNIASQWSITWGGLFPIKDLDHF